jgi:hypothetical protein
MLVKSIIVKTFRRNQENSLIAIHRLYLDRQILVARAKNLVFDTRTKTDFQILFIGFIRSSIE